MANGFPCVLVIPEVVNDHPVGTFIKGFLGKGIPIKIGALKSDIQAVGGDPPGIGADS